MNIIAADSMFISSLTIIEEYDNFETFISESREIIYKKMIDMYERIKDPPYNPLVLTISATIDDHPFESNFHINRDTTELLINSIIPFFESTEEYEICDKVLKLYHYLQEINH
jgi:hypothetical protein